MQVPESAIVERAFRLWGAQGNAPELLGGSNCWVYAPGPPDPGIVLRLISDAPERAGRIQAELDWMWYLGRRGAPVCAPFPSLAGRLLEPLAGPDPGERYLAALFRRARGKPVNCQHPEIWTPCLFELCGRTLGQLHALSKGFEPGPGARRDEWNGEALVGMARRNLPLSERAVLARLERCCEEMAGLPRGRDDFGLIHGDFHQGNYWLDGDRLEVFDFDSSMYAWYARDVAVALYGSLLDFVRLGERDLEAHARAYLVPFLAGYGRENRLGRPWIERLPVFLEAFNLQIFVSFFAGDGEPAGRIFELAREHARSGTPCLDLDFGRLFDEAMGEAA